MGDRFAADTTDANSLQISTNDSCSNGDPNYRQYRKELEELKDKQKVEVSRLQLQVDSLTKQRLHFQEQFKTCRSETNRYKEDLTKAQQQLEDLMALDGASNKTNDTIIERLKKEKSMLEKECKALKDLHKLLTRHPGNEAQRDELKKTKDELKELQSKYKSSERDNEELRIQLSALAEAITEAKKTDAEIAKGKAVEQISDMKRELRGTHNRVKELESSISDGMNDRNELSLKFTQSERQVAKLNASLRWMEKENVKLEKRHEDDQHSIWNLTAQEEYKRKEKQELDSDLKFKTARISSLEKEISSLKLQNAEFKTRMERFKKSEQDKNDAIAQLESVSSNAKENRQSVEEDLVRTRERLEKLKIEFKELQEDLFYTHKSLSDFQVDYKMLSDSKKQIEEELKAAVQNKSERQAALRDLEKEKNKKDYENVVLKEKLRKLKSEFEAAYKNCSTLSNQMNEYNKCVARSGEEMSEIQRKIDEYQSTCDELRQDVGSKECTIERLNDQISYMQSDMDSLNTDLSYTKAMYNNNEEEVKRLTLKLKACADENVRLSGMSHVAKKEKESLETQTTVADEKIRSLERECKKWRMRSEELEAKTHKNNTVDGGKKCGSPRDKSSAIGLDRSVGMETARNDSAREIHKLRQQLEASSSELTFFKRKLEDEASSKELEMQCRQEVEQKVMDLELEMKEIAKAKRNREDEFHKDRVLISDLELQIKNLKRQNALLQDQMAEDDNEVVHSKEELMKLELSVIEQKKASEIVNEAVKLRDKTNEELRCSVKMLQRDLVEAKDEIVQAKLAMDSKSEENDSLQRKTELQKEKIEAISKELVDMRESCQRLNAKMNSCSAKAHGFEMQLHASVREKDRYKSELGAALENIQKGKEELVTTQSLVQEKERKVLSYRSEMDEKETQIRKLLQEMDFMEKENIKLKKERVVAQFQQGVLTQNLKDAEETLRKSKLELNEFEVSIAQLQKQKELTDEEQELQNQDLELYREDDQRQRQGYKNIIDNLNARVSTLEKDIKEAHQQNIKMNVENSKLARRVYDLEGSVGMCEKEKKSIRENFIHATGKVSKLEVEFDNEKREVNTLRIQLKDASKRVDESRDEILRVNQQLVEQTVLVDRKTTELSNKDSKIEHLSTVNEYNEKTMNELKTNMSKCKGENERLKIEQDALRDELLALQRSVSESEMRCKVSLQEMAKAREEFRINSSKVASSYDTKMTEISKEKEELIRQLKLLKGELVQQQQDNEQMGRHNEQLCDIRKNYQNELDSKDNTIKCLHESKKEITRELNELKDILQDKDIELKEYEERISDLQDNKNNDSSMLEEKCKILENEVDALKSNKDELENKNRIRDAEEKELKKEILTLKGNSLSLEKLLEATEKDSFLAKEQLNESQSELETTKDSYTSASSDLEHVTDELEIAHNQLKEFKQQLEKSDALKYEIEDEMMKTKDILLKKYDEILRLQRKVQELQYKWDSHEEALLEKDESLKLLSEDKITMSKDLQSLRDEVNSMRNQIDSIMSQKSEIEKENFELKRNITDKETKLQGEALEREKLKESVLHYQKRILQFKDEVQSYGRQYKSPKGKKAGPQSKPLSEGKQK